MNEKKLKPESRRTVLVRAGAWLAAAGVLPGLALASKAFAQSKLKKDAVEYQDQPKNGKDCDDCMHFIPGKTAKAPGECKVVEGPVSAHGYCLAFTSKPKRN
jgi:hypothetical protein